MTYMYVNILLVFIPLLLTTRSYPLTILPENLPYQYWPQDPNLSPLSPRFYPINTDPEVLIVGCHSVDRGSIHSVFRHRSSVRLVEEDWWESISNDVNSDLCRRCPLWDTLIRSTDSKLERSWIIYIHIHAQQNICESNFRYMYVFLGKENMEQKTFKHKDILCTDSVRWTTNRSSERWCQSLGLGRKSLSHLTQLW